MKPLKKFEDFLREETVLKQMPNKARAMSLMKDSEKEHKFLMDIIGALGVKDEGANTIVKEVYDVVMLLIRGIMLADGFNSSGSFSHEAEVSYLKNLGFSENDIDFANRLRWFRNGIVYYGEGITADYALKALNFMKDKRLKLLEILQKRMK